MPQTILVLLPGRRIVRDIYITISTEILTKARIVTRCDVSGTDLAHLLLADPEFTHDECCGCVECQSSDSP